MIYPSIFKSILTEKCPACRKGRVFKTPIFNINFSDTHENCPHCHVKYESETGMYWSGMYISYAFTVGFVLISYFTLSAFGINENYLQIGIIVFAILLTPLIFRYSRILTLYGLGKHKFDKEKYKK